jgi:hypothetical protein
VPASIPLFVGFPKGPWNKGRLIGQKRPLKPKEVWAIRVRLQLGHCRRDLALFNPENYPLGGKSCGTETASKQLLWACQPSGRAKEV